VPLLDNPNANSMMPPPEVKERLLERLRTESLRAETLRAETSTSPEAPGADVAKRDRTAAVTHSHPSRRWNRWVPYVAAAAVAFVVGAMVNRTPEPLSHNQREQQYRERMAQIERSFDMARIQLATLATSPTSDDKHGAAVWDEPNGQVHLFAFGVTPAADGNVLVAWLVDAEQRYTPAGRLIVDGGREVAQVIDVPSQAGLLRQLVITEESADVERTQPTGPVRLVARFE
jgi:hypothetical protein